MTLQHAEQQMIDSLSTCYERAEAIAMVNLAMEHLTGMKRSQRRMQGQQALNEAQVQQWQTMEAALLRHRPVQYVIGEAWFYEMPFIVNEAVLIPRPETEELVRWVLEEKEQRKSARILDIGTGSGCIPIALKKAWNEAHVYALDISEAALEVARANASALHADIQFLQASILDQTQWPQLQFDIIVSNPPYIPQQESGMLDKNVTDWEPHLALFVPDNDPLLFYRKIAEFALQHLVAGGSVYFECHQQYAGAVAAMLQEKGFSATLKEDLFGNERMVKATPNKH